MVHQHEHTQREGHGDMLHSHYGKHGSGPSSAQDGQDSSTYTCPMHPQIRQSVPGNCPICGMSLEPLMPSLEEGPDPELVSFTRRFWWTLPLTIVVAFLGMAGHYVPWLSATARTWIELVLTIPIVFWAGWPFFVRWADSIRRLSPNMWTLIGTGVGAAFLYSLAATLVPGWFPAGFECGTVASVSTTRPRR